MKEISEFLKQNTDIDTIIVNYNYSKFLRQQKGFIIDEEYNGDYGFISKECIMGSISIDEKLYTIICDIQLEDDEIEFSNNKI